MSDASEKAIRDQQWVKNSAREEGLIEGRIKGFIEGKIKGEIKVKKELICFLQEILQLPQSSKSDFEGKSLEELHSIATDLRERIRERHSS